MVWRKWSLWSFILRRLAKAQGFLDPTKVFSSLQRFSQPSEVWVPSELLRSGAVLQARGLVNSQAIQHNLDWVWPLWVERQFNPKDKSFIPRAFSLTHINLTHRNWTALGVPGFSDFPLVDPHGLLTPFFDGWSLDAWIITNTMSLVPSRLPAVKQELELNGEMAIATTASLEDCVLHSRAEVFIEQGIPVCAITYTARSPWRGWLVISPRPYNPEGVSFINYIAKRDQGHGWMINKKHEIELNKDPQHMVYSNYNLGDVYNQVVHLCRSNRFDAKGREAIACDVGMASAAAMYEIMPHDERTIMVKIPLCHAKVPTVSTWSEYLHGHCALKVPDQQFQFLFDAALRTLVLHAPPGEVYPGPFTYKRFWFRDAAFILYAMTAVGLTKNVEDIIDTFPKRQSPLGYFTSQDGEWDSNGQALWIMQHFLMMTNRPVKPEWLSSVYKAVKWIQRKRLPGSLDAPHSGLLPPGFSAEHFGPSDFYYWDDFWTVAGLMASSYLTASNDGEIAQWFKLQSYDLLYCIEQSLKDVEERLNHKGIPASPYRRMDAGSIGSLAASYPLQLWPSTDNRILETAEFLIHKYFLQGAFYHEISHSGINAYLTLHVAQVLLRAGDMRFFDAVKAIADLASPTGQWPEAIHPRTKGGCMGDGQHVWAAAEWVLMIRNMFVREEEKERVLVLCSGIPSQWLIKGEEISLGPTLTMFGAVSVAIHVFEEKLEIRWNAQWYGDAPLIEVRLPGYDKRSVKEDEHTIRMKLHNPALF